jgi:hypothetical protein
MSDRQTITVVSPQLSPKAIATGAKMKQAIASNSHSVRTQMALTASYPHPLHYRKASFGECRKTVSAASYRLDQAIMPGPFQRRAETANMNVYRALLDKNVIPPYLIEQHGATMYALGVRHEEMQQAKLGRPEIKGLSVAGDPMRHRI